MDQHSLSSFDLVCLLLFAVLGLIGVMRGLLREVVSLASWVGASLAPIVYFQVFPSSETSGAHGAPQSTAATGLGVFLVTFLVLQVTGRLLVHNIQHPFATFIDRFLGMVFGLTRAYCLLALALIGILWGWPTKTLPAWIETSKVKPILMPGARLLINNVPDAQQRKITEEVRQIYDNALRKARERTRKDETP